MAKATTKAKRVQHSRRDKAKGASRKRKRSAIAAEEADDKAIAVHAEEAEKDESENENEEDADERDEVQAASGLQRDSEPDPRAVDDVTDRIFGAVLSRYGWERHGNQFEHVGEVRRRR